MTVTIRQGPSGKPVEVATPADITKGKSIVALGGGNIPATGTADRFLRPWYEMSDAPSAELFLQPFPFDATLRSLRAEWGPAGMSVNFDCVVRIDGVDTTIAFTSLSDATHGEDLVNEAPILAGQRLSIVVRKSAGTGSAMTEFQATLEAEPD